MFRGLLAGVAVASGSLSATVGYPSQFLDIDVDQFTGPISLIPTDGRVVGGPVTPVQATHPSNVQDALDG